MARKQAKIEAAKKAQEEAEAKEREEAAAAAALLAAEDPLKDQELMAKNDAASDAGEEILEDEYVIPPGATIVFDIDILDIDEGDTDKPGFLKL